MKTNSLFSFLFFAGCSVNIFAQRIAAGGWHSLALCSDSTVWSWGRNSNGQLGDGTTSSKTTAIQVGTITGITAITGGVEHSFALKSDGTVWAWGYNGFGQLGNGSTIDKAVPTQVTGLTGIVSIGWGHLHTHSLAVKNDGTAWAWGRNNSGQLGDGTTTQRTSPVQVNSLTGISAIGGGHAHSIALKNDGTVWAWGSNSLGQLGDGTTTNRNIPVQVHGPGNAGFLTSIIAIAVEDFGSLALKNDSTVWTWGNGNTSPIQVAGLMGIAALASGGGHSLALKKDGTVWAWGSNADGQLGDSTSFNKTLPVQVHGFGNVGFLTGITAISAGNNHSLAVKNDGTTWAWGMNNSGALGNGTNTGSWTPVQVSGLCATPTAANENTGQLSITVFPNPSNGKFNVEAGLKIESLEVYNVIGEKTPDSYRDGTLAAGQLTNDGSTAIDLTSNPSGIYFLYVKTAAGPNSYRIIVKKIIKE